MGNQYTGWLLDVYPNSTGVTVWLLGEDGGRHQLAQAFPTTFYVAGAFPRLRQLWRYLQQKPAVARLRRTQRRDLFAGLLDVMEVQVLGPIHHQRLFSEVRSTFADLDYYDADIPLGLRYAARFQVFPLTRCQVVTDKEGLIKQVISLDDRWDLDAELPPLRILSIEPNTDPSHRDPTYLRIVDGRKELRFNVEPGRLCESEGIGGKAARYPTFCRRDTTRHSKADGPDNFKPTTRSFLAGCSGDVARAIGGFARRPS